MLDFLKISVISTRQGMFIAPKFQVRTSKDLMIRGSKFYAIWDERHNSWSTDEYRAIELIDEELELYFKENRANLDERTKVLYLADSDSGSIDKWLKYCQKQMPDWNCPLDETVIFANTEVKKETYSTKKLSYPLAEGPITAYEQLINVLYSPAERHKLEWAIGAIISGDSRRIQKFLVLYGGPGTGKSTILNIIQDLFDGYCAAFDAEAIGSKSDAFALEPFKNNPLVAIQHDGDLSRIEQNARLNSLVSHEAMVVNTKHQSLYTQRFNSFLMMGTNKPVRITDAKSGILRRLIDVSPTGNKVSMADYNNLMSKIKFELGGIAWHCLQVYLEDKNYYDDYIPKSMLGASNDFYNFMLDNYELFAREDETTLKSAWSLYKEYCADANVPYPYTMRLFKEELKNYFKNFSEQCYGDHGERIHNRYEGFKTSKFDYQVEAKEEPKEEIRFKFDCTESILDDILKDCHAQYATADGVPGKPWSEVKTTLSDIDTHQLHYVRVPKNHIVIDFDLKTADGEKSFKKNLEAANKWPLTYAELSKSGAGIHLHYIYDGDVDMLAPLFDDGIEVKVFKGKSALRRMLTKCNDIPIATINTNLPLKGETKKVVNMNVVKSDKGLRALIEKNLRKEIHPSTKSSVDFIKAILDDAYANSELIYDVTDLRPKVMTFAANSSHQAAACLKLVSQMKFKSEAVNEEHPDFEDDRLVFYDVEVFPNLFLINWKYDGSDNVVRMINPKPAEVEELMKAKLVGFNCRRYDNHILYARMMGYSEAELFELSQRIINKSPNAMFGEAYNISFTDVYDFAATKQSLKKWEIELGIHHQELGLPWDKPVPEKLWPKVAEYCDNDVIATEAVFHHLKGDFEARQMLAALADMTVNDTTNSLTTRIIFGKERHPKLVYTDLATGKASDPAFERTDVINAFPGYTFENGVNMYRGEDVGKGGYVYAEPGMYEHVITFDVASMHPHSIIAMNCFGEYTERFHDILKARIAIKHKDFDTARKLMDGKLAPYLNDPASAKAVAQALKIAINSVYGLTAASFDNPFRDIRNANNIVALRGALFMVNLKHEVQDRGFTVAHVKTDSIKVVNPTQEIFDFIIDYGHKYGYDFEVEHKFEKICLVNNAVYVAKCANDDPESPDEWTATGTQFQVPYVFKTLFSKEELVFDDFCETKSATTALYLDMNEKFDSEDQHDYQFVGKVGHFCPIRPGHGGGELVRENVGKNGAVKYDSATGTKGYRWLESETVKSLGLQDAIDISYYDRLVEEAIISINEFGDFNKFVSA